MAAWNMKDIGFAPEGNGCFSLTPPHSAAFRHSGGISGASPPLPWINDPAAIPRTAIHLHHPVPCQDDGDAAVSQGAQNIVGVPDADGIDRQQPVQFRYRDASLPPADIQP